MVDRKTAPPPFSPAAGVPLPHESAHKHVTGCADYVDDIREPAGTLHAYPGLSDRASAEIAALDLDPVRTSPGVVGVLCAPDIPGANDLHPSGTGLDPILCDGRTSYHGQPVFLVVATSRTAARRAARRAQITYADRPSVLTVEAARAAGAPPVAPGMTLARGDVVKAISGAANRLDGTLAIGGQEHFYLEGQVALALPGEDGEIIVHSATQHPGDVQEITARMLGLPAHAVRVDVRRMGGGFGGKETQATVFATLAALAANHFKRPVKVRPDRDDDMRITGKRHDFRIDYMLGYSDDGLIEAVEARFDARCGHSEDLSRGVTDRALMHADNAYFYPAVKLQSHLFQTHTVSNTAFRGYGGPQGIVAAERMIEELAYALGLDPLEVRKRNFYGPAPRNLTPYHQPVRDNILARLVGELEVSCSYQERRKAVLAHNRTSRIIKRGIALVPVKFGIGFSKVPMNQAGVLLQVYRDGSVHLNHGGTEMGQGLHTKIAQLTAEALGVDLSRIRITPTATDKVPNASPTAGSLGTDLNGMASRDAARILHKRLARLAAELARCPLSDVKFEHETVRAGSQRFSWPEIIARAYTARVSLSAAGFYKTPHIHWDRTTGRGEPYLYFTYGAACAEVAVDTLTGEYRVERADILQDVGRSINPAVDIGQIEGGFIQGMGWLTTEELWWDKNGRLETHAPSTYKIPLASDRPKIFNVALADWSENAAPAVRRSKAVGEPPVMLAICVLEALGMAVASTADYRHPPRLDPPATPEKVFMAIERLGGLPRTEKPQSTEAPTAAK